MQRELRLLHVDQQSRVLQRSALREAADLQRENHRLPVHRLGYDGVPSGKSIADYNFLVIIFSESVRLLSFIELEKTADPKRHLNR